MTELNFGSTYDLSNDNVINIKESSANMVPSIAITIYPGVGKSDTVHIYKKGLFGLKQEIENSLFCETGEKIEIQCVESIFKESTLIVKPLPWSPKTMSFEIKSDSGLTHSLSLEKEELLEIHTFIINHLASTSFPTGNLKLKNSSKHSISELEVLPTENKGELLFELTESNETMEITLDGESLSRLQRKIDETLKN